MHAKPKDISLHPTSPLAVLALTVPVPRKILPPPIPMGAAVSPSGDEIAVDAVGLRRTGSRWLPVMGEFHYARYPEREWRASLLRMKMGGIDVVATYVFWIHHEETQGVFDWSGRRDLRRFIELCAEVGLTVVVRCGPWCHGECRNGGLPDWVLSSGVKTRSNDPSYLARVERLYSQIAIQIAGLLWKDGGPVIGIQFENEYSGPAEHLLELKRIGLAAGLDAPLYTRTGWPELTTPMPVSEMIPLFGGYPDGFWDRSLGEMPPGYGANFLFRLTRNDASVATDQLGVRAVTEEPENDIYPYFACEIGGGMMTSYHRRIQIDPRDIESLALAKIGSGNNLQGYYMFHGGTNPEGKLSPLQESQATGYWNDLPVKSYDFQAPLGEFGQVREHYHSLRRLHLFLRDFGPALAGMPASLPEDRPFGNGDTETLRWSVRSDQRKSGYVFVNNYQRLQPMAGKPDVQFDIEIDDTRLRIPAEPVQIPADICFFWPFNFDLRGVRLVYATAQPICRVADGSTTYAVFHKIDDVPTEFVFDGASATVESSSGKLESDADGQIRITQIPTSHDAAIRLRAMSGDTVVILLLEDVESLGCWKAELCGRDRIFLTSATLMVEGNRLRLEEGDPHDLCVGILPGAVSASPGLCTVTDGLFQRFDLFASPRPTIEVVVETVREAGPTRHIALGSQGVAEAPSDADFAAAAVFRLRFPEVPEPGRKILLKIDYVGDAARLILNGALLTDSFYNGTAFEIGLWRYAPEIYSGEMLLQILPIADDAPIYFQVDARAAIHDAAGAVHPPRVTAIELYEAEALFNEPL